ncbi:hypothetical protein CSB20_07605 [bacterium DOLZORAL124_64_63]|nr:MAG: hypothetical protein CSB20_07605 [bacterium DOLZORAL124_64_63]
MRRAGTLLAAMLAIMLAAMLATGCGVYSASSGRVDENIQRVYVEYLDNMTPEPNLGVDVAEGIIEALQVDNTLKVVDEGSADSILSGKVLRYHLKEVAARGKNLTVNEYQVQISVQLDFMVRATGEALFSKRRFNGTGNYVLGDDATDEATARREALTEIVNDILAQVVEDW